MPGTHDEIVQKLRAEFRIHKKNGCTDVVLVMGVGKDKKYYLIDHFQSELKASEVEAILRHQYDDWGYEEYY